MQPPQTTIINGLRMAAVPHGCCPFPAKYPAIWTLHLAVHDGEDIVSHRTVRGADARWLNQYAAAAQEHDLACFAWVTSADDHTAAA